MQATRDFSHYVKAQGSGISHMDLAVEGVSCAGCMSKIERGLSAIPDVTLARVNLTDRRVALEWKEGTLNPSRFIDRRSSATEPIPSKQFARKRWKRKTPASCCAALASRLSPP